MAVELGVVKNGVRMNNWKGTSQLESCHPKYFIGRESEPAASLRKDAPRGGGGVRGARAPTLSTLVSDACAQGPLSIVPEVPRLTSPQA